VDLCNHVSISTLLVPWVSLPVLLIPILHSSTNDLIQYVFRFVSSLSSPSDVGVPPPEEKYTGRILVSGYHVSFLPSKFPPLSKLGSRLDNGGDFTPLPTKLRVSTSEKNVILFMAGISLMVPYSACPQRAPWLVSFV
jgi:hypothetical protein